MMNTEERRAELRRKIAETEARLTELKAGLPPEEEDWGWAELAEDEED